MDIRIKEFLGGLLSEDVLRGAIRNLPATSFEAKTASGPGFSVSGTPCIYYGYMCTASSAMNISLYHGTSTSGVLLRTVALAVNDSLVLPVGLELPNGLYMNLNSGTGTVLLLAS